MNPEDYYFLSDAKCIEKKAPVCVLRQNARVVVAQGGINYYPALDQSFKTWNRMVGCEDSDDSDESSDYTSDESQESSKDEEEEDDDEDDEGEGKEVEGKEGEEEGEMTKGGEEESTTRAEENDGENEVGSGMGEIGSGMGELGDDEDIVYGSGFSQDLNIGRDSNTRLIDYNAIHDILVE